MSFENKFKKDIYIDNRNRVFDIYGINSKNKQYNCHHITTKLDLNIGIVSPIFDVDNKSNLYPLRVSLHHILNQIIEAVDSDENIDIEPLRARWKQTEEAINRPIKVKIKQKPIPNPMLVMTAHESSSVFFYNKRGEKLPIRSNRLTERAENKTFVQKLSKEDVERLMEYKRRFNNAQEQYLKEFLLYDDGA